MAGGGHRRRKRANKPKPRQPLKDHLSGHTESDLPQLQEELTALSAIFQDDFTLISENPFTEFSINLQPHSVDVGAIYKDVSAELHVRCIPGYPHKPPKLHIKSKEGLSEEELHLLHSMLVDQASSISREGRVMVFNLVEAAQEFLSEHVGSDFVQEQQFQEKQKSITSVEDTWVAKVSKEASYDSHDVEVSDVYGVVDLFTDSHWEGEPQTAASVQLQTNKIGVQKNLVNPVESGGRPERLALGYVNVPDRIIGYGELNTALKGRSRDAEKDGPPEFGIHFSSVSDLLQKVRTGLYSTGCKKPIPVERGSIFLGSTDSEEERVIPSSDSTTLTLQDGSGQSVQKDFVLAHLLRLVCCPRGPLPHTLPVLASQLQKLGIIPEWLKDLVIDQPQLFDLAFRSLFLQCIRDTNVSSQAATAAKAFWSAGLELLGEDDSTGSRVTSRYLNDFQEVSSLGRGGFGHVVLCINKLDGRQYAVKKIRLKDRSPSLNKKILREVATLSRLQHHHIVRYYQAWFETVVGIVNGGSKDLESSGEWILSGNLDEGDSSFRQLLPQGMRIDDVGDRLVETTCLYIQMEYCPRTLREVLGPNRNPMDEATSWGIFRQIVEGLAHIHGQGIIHRDLNPNNIFFDTRNDIKIGDFGLAKFANLDRDPFITPDANSSSLDGTGQVGTYFYTAPEVDQGWPHIDEKVDMYSLGVVLFELWYPFNTAMERHVTLTELKLKNVLPSKWALEFQQQAALVRSLMAPNPAERPSAMHVLRNELPPRMEDQALDDILRTIQRADNSYVFDRIISAIFDEERISSISQNLAKEELNCEPIQEASSQDRILGIAKDVFTWHGARRFNSRSMSLVDDARLSNRRQAVRLIDSAGRMLELRSETRIRFACWVAAHQITSLKCFEISQVYRKGTGPSAPREYYQGDFDMIGGAFVLAEAEAIKVAVDIICKSTTCDSCEIRINHSNILDAIWSWSGVKRQQRQDVAKLLSSVGCAPPQSSDRKSRWVIVRRQLLQGLQLSETVVDRLQIVERRLSGLADEALARLRGALPASTSTSSGIDELYTLLKHLRVWHMDKYVLIDALMAPAEEYYRGIFFQIHLPKGCCHATSSAEMLLAVGGRYDQLVRRSWASSLASSAPGAVGLSIALEKLIIVAASERNEIDSGAEVLVCSKGGGGLLRERMEVVSELWAGNIKAEFVCLPAPSLTEQYEYAHEHGIKWLVIITESGLSHTNSVKVRHLELRVEEDIRKVNIVKFFTDMPVTPTNIRKKAASLREGN